MPLPQEMEVSFLYSLTFNLGIHSYAKLNTYYPTLSPKKCCIPAELLQHEQNSQPHLHHPRRQAPLPLLQEGCCVRLYFKAKQKKHQDSLHLTSLGSATLPFIHLGATSFSLWEELLQAQPATPPLFSGEGEGEDPFLELCAKTVFKPTDCEMRPWDGSPAYICPFITEQLWHLCMVQTRSSSLFQWCFS